MLKTVCITHISPVNIAICSIISQMRGFRTWGIFKHQQSSIACQLMASTKGRLTCSHTSVQVTESSLMSERVKVRTKQTWIFPFICKYISCCQFRSQSAPGLQLSLVQGSASYRWSKNQQNTGTVKRAEGVCIMGNGAVNYVMLLRNSVFKTRPDW